MDIRRFSSVTFTGNQSSRIFLPQSGQIANPAPASLQRDVFSPSPKKPTPTFGAGGKHIFGASKSIAQVPQSSLPEPPENLPSELHDDWYDAQQMLQGVRYPQARLELQKQLTKPEHMNKEAYEFIQECFQMVITQEPRLRTDKAQKIGQLISHKIAEAQQQ